MLLKLKRINDKSDENNIIILQKDQIIEGKINKVRQRTTGFYRRTCLALHPLYRPLGA